LLVHLGLFPSNSEAQRKIKEGAVYMAVGESEQPDWKRLTDPTWNFDPHQYPVVIFRTGTRPPVRVVFGTGDADSMPN
jgi:tyrosyl-tRNA synthetase